MTDVPQKINAVEHLITVQSGKRFEEALANKPVSFPAWKVAVLAEFRRLPDLYKCAVEAPETVAECLAVAAGCGLMPGKSYDQFYLIPRWNGRTKRTECTFITGYKGLIDLAMRHRRVHSVEAFLVYEGEKFSWSPATGELVHEWSPTADRSPEKIVAAYSCVRLTTPDGQHVEARPLFWAMTRDEIMIIRDRSQAYQQAKRNAEKWGKEATGPWFTDEPKMMRKTVIRSHFGGGSIPRALELVELLSREVEEELAPADDAEPRSTVANATEVLQSALGISTPRALPVMDLPDEALHFIKNGATVAEVLALQQGDFLSQWSGVDREMIEQAMADRLREEE